MPRGFDISKLEKGAWKGKIKGAEQRLQRNKQAEEVDPGVVDIWKAFVRAEAGITESSGVARTILDQLGGLRKIQAMTGAKNFLYDRASVQFKLPTRSGPNYVKVTLDPDDTYTMEFGRIVQFEVRGKKQIDGLYADQLRSTFEHETGLRLSL